jgi:threonine dehydratase
MSLPIEFSDVEAARERSSSLTLRTPVLRSPAADQLTGGELFFKCENLQRTGAFKFRGAVSALTRFDARQRAAGVISYSSGNHAQAIALAARLLNIPALIVMPKDAPPIKLEATRSYGAEVILYDRYTEDREAIGRRLADERGMTLVPPFDHVDVMAGQGTAALELFEETGPLDLLVVCVGGGGLISGCATVAHALSPACRVIGVEPSAGDDVRQSLARGERVSIAVPQTIADGAQTQAPGVLTFPVIQKRVAQILTVDDPALVRTLHYLAAHLKLVVEPTGCLAAAAVLEGTVDVHGQRVGIILSGGNVDPTRLPQFLAQGAPRKVSPSD